MRNWHWLLAGIGMGMFFSIGFGFVAVQSSGRAVVRSSPLTGSLSSIDTARATAAEQQAADRPEPGPQHQQLAQVPTAAVLAAAGPAAPADDGKLRIVAFGAHPDDCELDGGGAAAMWADLGHHVKLVSVTNGDIGHWRMAGGAGPATL